MRALAATLFLTGACLATGCDSGGDSEPVASNDSAQVSPGEAVVIDVLRNDQGEGLTIEAFQSRSANRGQVTETDDGKLSYRPLGGFLGADSFTYSAKSSSGATSKNATVTVLVQ